MILHIMILNICKSYFIYFDFFYFVDFFILDKRVALNADFISKKTRMLPPKIFLTFFNKIIFIEKSNQTKPNKTNFIM